MYNNIYRDLFLQIERMQQSQPRNYLCKVLEFNVENFTIKGEVLTEAPNEPLIIEPIHVFSSPLITTQLRPNDFVILINLGFNLGDFYKDRTIGDEGGQSSLIALPLNNKPSKQGTTIQAPKQDQNTLILKNDRVTLQQENTKLELKDAITLQDNNNNSLVTNTQGATLKGTTLTLQSDNAPLNLNGASFTQAMEQIVENLRALEIAIAGIKFTPGTSSVEYTPTVNAIEAIQQKVR